MRYFTSDTHFGHTNIIKYCTRPFPNASVMDAVLVQNWNETIQRDDTIYHLGDVAFASPDRIKHILSNLNGHKILILGNHDRSGAKMKEFGFDEVLPHIKQLELSDGTIANLSHYPYRGTADPAAKRNFDTKNLNDDGRLLICGHVHVAWKNKPGQYKNHMVNVGVDQWGFKPVSEPELLAYVKTLNA